VTRKQHTRAALRRRLLLVYRTNMATGASDARAMPVPAGFRLVALAINPGEWGAASSLPVAAIEALTRRHEADIRQHIDRATGSWRQQMAEVHRAFIETRLTRERAIGAIDEAAPAIVQPGLFDRRVERARQALRAAAADRHDDRAAVVARLEQRLVLAPTDPELMLVLIPA
jgi:hypothetical protein